MDDINASGTLDEALDRLHLTGPEHWGWMSNHAPMAVEALARHGQAPAVHPWIDRYRDKLEDMPAPNGRITDENWRELLGDARHLADWIDHFTRLIGERPWRDVLAEWWPRLLPGIAAGATHPVIRVGHAVRTLLRDGETAPRTVELAHALGYWAARHLTLPTPVAPHGTAGPGPALAAVPRVPDQSGGVLERLAQLPRTPGWQDAVDSVRPAAEPEGALTALRDLVTAATCRYGRYELAGDLDPVMLVHAATAPNAVLRILPALPQELWPQSMAAAWAASAAVTAAYAPGLREGPGRTGRAPTTGEVFLRAAANGNEHAIKFADTALDVAAASPEHSSEALAAAIVSCELLEPIGP
ncbi:questin oxidase family protein [Streptomyces gamaensis]|uniref:Questin oxidase family protein n=1 Tax=Streptomyces gamaensis TaxID=1763542 RepID=A0ABW0YZK3_9ACTN